MTVDEELRIRVRVLLDEARSWKLPPRDWALVLSRTQRLRAAVVGGTAEMVCTAAGDLELAGPVRALPLEEDPAVDLPDDVREELDAAVRSLDGPAPQSGP